MNDLQRTEFEILKEVLRVCDLLHIPYFLVCGSALGAAKYKGFIPWDDDIDIGIMREDYERFLQQAQKHLPAHLFLQTFRTDPAYPQFYAKVRNSNTTYIEKSVAHIPMNHGVYIDVFPLDGLPKNPKQQKRLLRKLNFFKLTQTCAYQGDKSFKLKCLTAVFRIFGVHKRLNSRLEKIDALLNDLHDPASDTICNHGNWQGSLEFADKNQYGRGSLAFFEGLEVRIPEQYDAYLTQKYGKWKEDLPDDQKQGHHFSLRCDLSRPYSEF